MYRVSSIRRLEDCLLIIHPPDVTLEPVNESSAHDCFIHMHSGYIGNKSFLVVV